VEDPNVSDNFFKVGDRVKYVGGMMSPYTNREKVGKVGTVQSIRGSGIGVLFDEGGPIYDAFEENLELLARAYSKSRRPPRQMVRGDLVSCSWFPFANTPPENKWGSINVEYGRVDVNLPPRYYEAITEVKSVVNWPLYDAIKIVEGQRDEYAAGYAAQRTKVGELELKIADLENNIKVNAEFIELQGNRLRRARNHLARVSEAVRTYEPEDNGPGLDP
jgi:hypothetical protein